MSSDPDYYQILGVEPTADREAITAAYNGRSLRFRVNQLRNRADELPGPSQAMLDEAYNILNNPQLRTIYDETHYPGKSAPTSNRRRLPAWLWAFATVWIVAIVIVGCIGIRSRITPDSGAIGQILQTVTVTAAASTVGETATVPPTPPRSTIGSSGATSTVAAALPPTVSATAAATSTIAARPTTAVVVTRTVMPTQNSAATIGRTVTSTVPPTPPPTATIAPTATTLPPSPTPEPPPVIIEPTQEPTEVPPSFQPTDRIGTALSVNLRSGPGIGYGSLGLLPTGTQLAATGETAYSGGQLWRRFTLRDGRVGWVRDLDVFSVR